MNSTPKRIDKKQVQKIYVVCADGWQCEISYIVCSGLNKLDVIKFDIEKEHNQNSHIRVFDAKTMKELYECDVLVQYSNKSLKCNCPDCKSNDEVKRWCNMNNVGNFNK